MSKLNRDWVAQPRRRVEMREKVLLGVASELGG